MWEEAKKLKTSGVFVIKFENGMINKAMFDAKTKKFTIDGITLNNVAFIIPTNAVNITQHKCPTCNKLLLEEETSLLHCYDCCKEYYIFRGKVMTLYGGDGVTKCTSKE